MKRKAVALAVALMAGLAAPGCTPELADAGGEEDAGVVEEEVGQAPSRDVGGAVEDVGDDVADISEDAGEDAGPEEPAPSWERFEAFFNEPEGGDPSGDGPVHQPSGSDRRDPGGAGRRGV